MARGLTNIDRDGRDFNGNLWPMEVGAVVVNGKLQFHVPNNKTLHTLDARGNYCYWVVVEYDQENVKSPIYTKKYGIMADTLKIIHITEDKSELLPYFSDIVFNSEWACEWALKIGDNDIMREYVVESCWAYYWARHIGDNDLMRPFVTDPVWAYSWANTFGDKDLMRPFVMYTPWMLSWIKHIGEVDIMLPLVINTRWATDIAQEITYLILTNKWNT